MKSLFTQGALNPKTAKGAGFGYETLILHLAPATLSGVNVCPWSTDGCRTACLNTAGRGAMHTVQDARIRKTQALFADRAGFIAQLSKEIGALERRCKRNGTRPVVRLNGTSDLPWETVGGDLFADHPGVQFMDYTKSVGRAIRARTDLYWPVNYDLTFSWSGDNGSACATVLDYGGRVAVPFAGDLPERVYVGSSGIQRASGMALGSFHVVDGEKSDLRFLDPDRVVVGLRAKGRARKDDTGFVVG